MKTITASTCFSCPMSSIESLDVGAGTKTKLRCDAARPPGGRSIPKCKGGCAPIWCPLPITVKLDPKSKKG